MNFPGSFHLKNARMLQGYEGAWMDNRAHGHGTFTESSGTSYEGGEGWENSHGGEKKSQVNLFIRPFIGWFYLHL